MNPVLTIACLPCLAVAVLAAEGGPRDDRAAEALGWRLSLQCWTCNDLTTFEALDRAKELGLRYVELFPGQRLRPDSEARVQPDMSVDERDRLLAKLKANGLKAVNFGVVALSGDDAADRPAFVFAKALGIETLTAEPPQDALAAVEKLADEYGINVALHNHPKPSRYWDPKVAYDAVRSYGPRLGLCADTGHWERSSIDPVDALRKYGDRVITFHFKDLDEFGTPEAHDVPWGSGIGHVREILELLRNRQFHGVFSIEYEIHPADQLAQVAACIAEFDRLAAEVAKQPPTTQPVKTATAPATQPARAPIQR